MAQDPYKYFRIEARDLVGELEKGVLELEKTADGELLARLLRYAHTLKGAARIVKHRELAELAHAMEGVLAPLRGTVEPRRQDAAIALVDQMTAQLATLDPAKPAAAAEPAAPALPSHARAIDDALAGLASARTSLRRALAGDGSASREALLEQVDRGLDEARRDIEHLRLVPIDALFTQLQRTARDAALASRKTIALSTHGADVRLEADVLAVLQGALVQLVRNAVAHGIEREGRITIRVQSRGRAVQIVCADDGRGLDVAAIRAAAASRGIATDAGDDAARLFELLLRGGISTSKRVDEIAGRGIGLDIVRSAVERLGGEIRVASKPAQGTTVTLTVPVSTSAMSMLFVESAGQLAAIPRAAVVRVALARASQVVRSGDTVCIALDDTIVPCVPLWRLLGRRGAGGVSYVFVDGGAQRAAIAVDRVVGIEDAVARPLSSDVPVDPNVWAVTIGASGDAIPIIDPATAVATAAATTYALDEPPTPIRPILVVDDSLTTRMLEQNILESAGFAVDIASSAEEALDKLARTPYSLALVDVEMPGMDGFGLIATIRSRPAIADLPAILVTSRDAPADRRRGSDVGAQGYIVKSQFDQGALIAMIRKLVRT